MKVPGGLRDSVAGIFGPEGERWLKRLPRLLRACIEKWSLSDCSPCEEMSSNFVCPARSPDFGRVVLKVGVPHPELFTEMRALGRYGGRGICRCWDC
ncbi:MAG: aminoglycoside/hydroxyurea antibiotic resistance kinase, partial [Bacillota bacterium]